MGGIFFMVINLVTSSFFKTSHDQCDVEVEADESSSLVFSSISDTSDDSIMGLDEL